MKQAVDHPERFHRLNSWRIQCVSLDPKAVELLVWLMNAHTKDYELALMGVSFTENAEEMFFSTLRCPKICTLRIGGISLIRYGHVIKNFLQRNSHIRQVSFDHCEIDETACDLIHNGIGTLQRLCRLDMRYMETPLLVYKALADVIEKRPIRELDFYSGNIDDSAAPYLARIISAPGVLEVFAALNTMTVASRPMILDAVMRSHTLRSVDIGGLQTFRVNVGFIKTIFAHSLTLVFLNARPELPHSYLEDPESPRFPQCWRDLVRLDHARLLAAAESLQRLLPWELVLLVLGDLMREVRMEPWELEAIMNIRNGRTKPPQHPIT